MPSFTHCCYRFRLGDAQEIQQFALATWLSSRLDTAATIYSPGTLSVQWDFTVHKNTVVSLIKMQIQGSPSPPCDALCLLRDPGICISDSCYPGDSIAAGPQITF